MQTVAIVLKEPERIALDLVEMIEPGPRDAVIDVEWSGISAGTERLLWQGRMPHFPGMGYPLVPGYESVGRVAVAGTASGLSVGERVFVPGASCFVSARSLFGATAREVVVPAARVVPIGGLDAAQSTLLALAATAYHMVLGGKAALPDLIIGHGVLGRLLARISIVLGGAPPIVWELDRARAEGYAGYNVLNPEDDKRRDYRCIYDVSGDSAVLDQLIQRLAPGGEIVLGGFYCAPLSFAFPPAFMREARLRVSAQFLPADLVAARDAVQSGALSLDGLITHQQPAGEAANAYRTAFEDPTCLKMLLDWRNAS